MGPRTKSAHTRNVGVDDLLSIFESIGLTGVQLKPSQSDVNRDLEPLQPVISQLRSASSTNGPLSEAADIISALLQHHNKDDESQHIWKTLDDAGISIEALVELLHHLADVDRTPLAIAACCLYFALLRMPGAFLYHVFSALVFRTCITSLKKWIYIAGGTNLEFLIFLVYIAYLTIPNTYLFL